MLASAGPLGCHPALGECSRAALWTCPHPPPTSEQEVPAPALSLVASAALTQLSCPEEKRSLSAVCPAPPSSS